MVYHMIQYNQFKGREVKDMDEIIKALTIIYLVLEILKILKDIDD